VGQQEFVKLLRGSVPDGAVRLKQIRRVVVRGDRATVIFKEPGSTGHQPVVRRGGVWVVDAP
jgi:hypothetical protein